MYIISIQLILLGETKHIICNFYSKYKTKIAELYDLTPSKRQTATNIISVTKLGPSRLTKYTTTTVYTILIILDFIESNVGSQKLVN